MGEFSQIPHERKPIIKELSDYVAQKQRLIKR